MFRKLTAEKFDFSREKPPLKLAILSDTHGKLDPNIAELIADCDMAVHAGDIGNTDVIRQIQPKRDIVLCVLGNNDTPDNWDKSEHGTLHRLAEEIRIKLPGGELHLLHGHKVNPAARRHELLRRRYADARAVVYGHSHRLQEDMNRQPWILNPGAAGRARTHGGPSCLILTIDDSGWRIDSHRFPLPQKT